MTNVPGPQVPLYLLGRRMLAVYPLVPLAANTALGIAVLSYYGRLNFGLNADYDSLPDLELLARDLEQVIAETVQAASANGWPSGSSRTASVTRDSGTESPLIVAHLDLPHPACAPGVLAGRVCFDRPTGQGPQEAREIGHAARHLALLEHYRGRRERGQALGDGGVDAAMNESKGLLVLLPHHQPAAGLLSAELQQLQTVERVEAPGFGEQLVVGHGAPR